MSNIQKGVIIFENDNLEDTSNNLVELAKVSYVVKRAIIDACARILEDEGYPISEDIETILQLL